MARKQRNRNRFSGLYRKSRDGGNRPSLGICGYGTLQAPDFDEQERLADSPVETGEAHILSLASGLVAQKLQGYINDGAAGVYAGIVARGVESRRHIRSFPSSGNR